MRGRLALVAFVASVAFGLFDSSAAAPAAGAPASSTQARPAAAVPVPPLRQAMLAAEDGRAETPAERQPLLDGLADRDPVVRRQAVRALGRLEQPDLAGQIASRLDDSSPAVRAEAAGAMGQALVRAAAIEPEWADRLLGRLQVETDAGAAAALCRTIGRIPWSTEVQVRLVEERLVAATTRQGVERTVGPGDQLVGVTIGWRSGTIDASVPVLEGAVAGLESLFRLRRKIAAPSRATLDRLRTIALTARPRIGLRGASSRPRSSNRDRTAPARRLALMVMAGAGPLDRPTLGEAFQDPDWQVRRLAVVSLAAGPAGSLGEEVRAIVSAALADPAPQVRADAVRAYLRQFAGSSCDPLVRATADRSLHVALAAIDALPACVEAARGAGGDDPARQRDADGVVEELGRIASREFGAGASAPGAAGGWHAPAHALAALGRVAPVAIGSLLSRAAIHPIWQVRMYAARAAADIARRPPATDSPARLAATEILDRLAADAVANVRTAAIEGLAAGVGHRADPRFVEALSAADYQLVIAGARALAGTPDRSAAVEALFAALSRLTAERRDTSRDPRRALVDRLAELGSAADQDRMAAWLDDFDPAIARGAASALTAWTGRPHEPRTRRIATGSAPSASEAAGLAGALLEITMADAGRIVLRLLPDAAPATVLRLARLARAGYYDGLTFHRVVTNFVVQGGSPGANEYAGDGPYMRDEIGARGHARGTVGISTRGRDTGDAQIFINLVDNPRLDHDYTVCAEVVEGMDRVDAIAEGDVMRSVRLLVRAGRGR